MISTGGASITPLLEGAGGAIETAGLGLLDFSAGTSADPWYRPEQAVIHVGPESRNDDGTWSTSTEDVAGRLHTRIDLAIKSASDERFPDTPYDQLNSAYTDDVFGAGKPVLSLVNLTGPSGATFSAVNGASTYWSSEGLSAGEPQNATVQIGVQRNLGLVFSAPGQYCVTIDESLPTFSQGTVPMRATYTFYVGDLPPIVTTCDQAGPWAGDGGDAEVTVIDRGHTDLRAGIAGGQLVFGVGSSLLPLEDVVLGRTPPSAVVPTPDSTGDHTAIGPPGTEYWYFPASSSAEDFLWPGFSTESVAPGDIGTPLSFTLRGYSVDGVEEPEGSKIVLQDGFGPRSTLTAPDFDSSRGITSFEYAANVHAHPVWAFTQPGLYCVNLSVDALSPSGARMHDDGLLTMVVGDEVPEGVEPCERQYPDSASWPRLGASTSLEPAPGSTTVIAGVSAAIASVIADDEGLDAVLTSRDRPTGRETTHDLDHVVIASDDAVAAGGYRVSSETLQLSTERLDGAVETLELGLGDVRGPGSVVVHDNGRRRDILDSAVPGQVVERVVPSRTSSTEWRFSAAGVYCVPIVIAAGDRSATKTLTVAVGLGDASHISPCADGQQPGDGGVTPPDPGAGDDRWNVPNGSLTDSGAVILNDGHIDIASLVSGSSLPTLVKDTTESNEPVWRDPAKTVLQLLPDSKTTVPDNPAFAFLGQPGSAFWQVSQTQQPELLWPGWSTESIPVDATQGGIAWTLDRVEGPGEFALYQTSQFGTPSILFNTRDGLPDAYTIPKNVHAHGSWAFSAEGVYCLAFTRSATLASGVAASDEFTLAIAVGTADVRSVDPAECFTVPTDRPAELDTNPVADDRLTAASRGDVSVVEAGSGFTPGQLVTVQVGQGRAGQWVSVWLHSPAVWTGWHQVSADGTIQMRLPVETTLGVHAVSVKSRTGALIGWGELTVIGPPPPPPADPVPPAAEPGPASTALAATQCVAGATVLSSGHVDFASRIIGGKLESLVKDGTSQTVVWREPSGTIIHVVPAAAVPVASQYSAIGPVGSTIWQIPQTQQPGIVWLGWNTEEISRAAAASGVTWSLDSVSGPGTVKVYLQGSFGGVQEMVFDGSGRYTIDLGKHVHGNWAFSAPGVYRLAFTQSVTLPNGQVTSDSETLAFAVGVDPASAISGGSGCGAVSTASLDADAAAAAAAAEAAAQAAAAAAAAEAAAQRGPGSQDGLDGTDDAESVDVATTSSVVPTLLLVLGLLLLVGVIAGGLVLWSTRRSRAGPGNGRA